MILYIVRHGESMANIGQTEEADCLLSMRGEAQALRLPRLFEDAKLDGIFSSPLKRTILTATPLACSQALPIILMPEMTEYFNLEWTAYRDHAWTSCRTIESVHEGVRFVACHDPERQWWPNWPEERREVSERVKQFYERELVPLFGTDRRIAVFGHGATTTDLSMLACPDAVFPPLLVATNAVVYEYHLVPGGSCMAYRVHFEHLSGL